MEIKQVAKRAAVVGSTSIVVGGVLLCGIIYYQEWSIAKEDAEQREARRILFESQRLSVDNPPRPESFVPMRAVPPMPAITEIKTVSADEIKDEVADDDLVLGVEIDGEARAYSINMLTGPSREIFNDALAGEPIAATW